jgi:hypothetical protein
LMVGMRVGVGVGWVKGWRAHTLATTSTHRLPPHTCAPQINSGKEKTPHTDLVQTYTALRGNTCHTGQVV